MNKFGVSRQGFMKAYFDNRSDPVLVRRVQVRQKEYQHDIAIIDVAGDAYTSQFRTGVTVEVQYGANKWTDSFFGYVNHSEPTQNRSVKISYKRTTPIVCVGASWKLKDHQHFVYNNRSASSVMREITNQYQFTADIEEDDTIWDSLSSSGESVWGFFVSLAKRMGRTLYCHKTEIRCLDQMHHLVNKESIPTFYGVMSSGNAVTIEEFKAKSGETTPTGGERVSRSASGINPWTGSSFTVLDDMSSLEGSVLGRVIADPFFSKIETGIMAQTYEEAQRLLAASTKLNRFHIQAEATLLGDPRVTQGTLVALSGVGTQHDGYWYVHEVLHDVMPDKYVMKVKLGRDSYESTKIDPQVGRRVVRDRYDPFDKVVSAVPPTILVNKVWRSAFAAKRQVPNG